MENFLILTFAGYSGAGKSTLSKRVSQSLNLEFIEHQPLLHEIAISKGFERSRHWLAEVGMETFIAESQNKMLEKIDNVVKSERNGVVIDVVYNQSMLEKIRQRFPESKLFVIGVDTEAGMRGERISGRMGGVTSEEGIVEREFRDKFLREAGMEAVINNIDIHITNNGDIEATEAELMRKLKDKI